MSTLTPNELTYPVTPPAIDAAAGLTTTYGEVVRVSSLDVARERDDVRRHIGLVEAPKASARADRHGHCVFRERVSSTTAPATHRPCARLRTHTGINGHHV